MKDWRAHEAAALVVGAFAFRECADDMTDVRWALNRMTAHLAMATALRGTSTMTSDGQIATALLLLLSDRQDEAISTIESLAQTESESARTWARALRTRVTEDWRIITNPSTATRVEKLAYFRARRATVGRARAAEDLRQIDERIDADWVRIAAAHPCCVEDGHEFISDALAYEFEEIGEVHQLVLGEPLPEVPDSALNVHPTPLVTDDGVRVLPWGAWAAFFQRHVAMHVGKVDYFYRHLLGVKDDADAAAAQMDRKLGKLSLYPLGAIRRDKGPNGTEADLAWLPEAIDLTARAPEVITRLNWTWIEYGQRYEPSVARPPSSSTWFAYATEEQPFEPVARLKRGTPTATLEKLLSRAPYNHKLLRSGLTPVGNAPRSAAAMRSLQIKAEYDVRAMDLLADAAETDKEVAAYQRRACTLSPRDCVRLAWTLVRLGEIEAAAAQFERAFNDPAMDAVAVANESYWLVNYYFEKKRLVAARALANRAESTGSYGGLLTKAWLLEQLREYDEAQELYEGIAHRYNRPAPLLGFYYRQAIVRGDRATKPLYDDALRAQFPDGLQPAPTAMDKPPARGVYIYTETAAARRAGLRAGDIVIGLEDWRVDNADQYFAINAFFVKPEMKITIWRNKLITIETKMPGRLFGVDLKTYPLKGWIES